MRTDRPDEDDVPVVNRDSRPVERELTGEREPSVIGVAARTRTPPGPHTTWSTEPSSRLSTGLRGTRRYPSSGPPGKGLKRNIHIPNGPGLPWTMMALGAARARSRSAQSRTKRLTAATSESVKSRENRHLASHIAPRSRRSELPPRGHQEPLDASGANITDEGVSAVAADLQRFAGGGTLEAPEQGMLDRLASIAAGDVDPTSYDLNFYTHELNEAGRYAQLGYGPESGVDLGSPKMYDVWNNVHTAALEDYGISGSDLFYQGIAP